MKKLIAWLALVFALLGGTKVAHNPPCQPGATLPDCTWQGDHR